MDNAVPLASSLQHFPERKKGHQSCDTSQHTLSSSHHCLSNLKQDATELAENYGFECSTCMVEFGEESLVVPRNLDCGHTFCTGCLEKFISSTREISCPKCQIVSRGKDVCRLPKNYGVMDIIGGTTSRTPSPRMPRRSQQYAPTYCPDHGDHLSTFCITDNKLVCSSCLLYGEHKHHKCLLVTEAAQHERKLLDTLLPEVADQQKRMHVALKDVEGLVEQIQSSGGGILDTVNAQFDKLVAHIEEKRMALKLELMKRTQLRVCALQEQVRLLQDSIAKASTAVNTASSLLNKDNFTVLQWSGSSKELLEAIFINPVPTLPLAMDDLACYFSSDVESEVLSLVNGYGYISSSVDIVKNLHCQPYHDGVRITWSKHNFVDNQGISYHLQVSCGGGEYINLFRGGDTKFTWYEDLKEGLSYSFRVQVRTTEGVGNWSNPVVVKKALPSFRWSDQCRSLRIELSQDKLEAWWGRGSSLKYWATFGANRVLGHGLHYMEVEIIELGKLKPNKKLVLGVMKCASMDAAKAIDWQCGMEAVGVRSDMTAWSFHPIRGVITSSVKSSSEPKSSLGAAEEEGEPYSDLVLQSGDRIGMLVDTYARGGGKINFFYNKQDLGLAFGGINSPQDLLPVVSIRDKIRLRLIFPPPPYQSRMPHVTELNGL